MATSFVHTVDATASGPRPGLLDTEVVKPTGQHWLLQFPCRLPSLVVSPPAPPPSQPQSAPVYFPLRSSLSSVNFVPSQSSAPPTFVTSIPTTTTTIASSTSSALNSPTPVPLPPPPMCSRSGSHQRRLTSVRHSSFNPSRALQGGFAKTTSYEIVSTPAEPSPTSPSPSESSSNRDSSLFYSGNDCVSETIDDPFSQDLKAYGVQECSNRFWTQYPSSLASFPSVCPSTSSATSLSFRSHALRCLDSKCSPSDQYSRQPLQEYSCPTRLSNRWPPYWPVSGLSNSPDDPASTFGLYHQQLPEAKVQSCYLPGQGSFGCVDQAGVASSVAMSLSLNPVTTPPQAAWTDAACSVRA
ncbi:unnamed protein product [Protopolystoma xenopodis]|uniref:Uncharacterized protein n=1 Tax=Protopolystoma xenopodis TaxID=117903 RepID=A0A448XDW5_9PLAT|nr:unnamed protein product [Protopolystoma xenopodis]